MRRDHQLINHPRINAQKGIWKIYDVDGAIHHRPHFDSAINHTMALCYGPRNRKIQLGKRRNRAFTVDPKFKKIRIMEAGQ